MVSKFLMISFILMLVALIVYIIGFSTRHFIDIDQPNEIYVGLWVSCGQNLVLKICRDTTELANLGNRGWFKAWRATSILGLIFLFAATICASLKLFAFKEKKYTLIAGIGMTFAAVVSILAAVIVFTENVAEDLPGLPFKYGFSFALTIVGMCIAGISAGFMVVEYCMGVHE